MPSLPRTLVSKGHPPIWETEACCGGRAGPGEPMEGAAANCVFTCFVPYDTSVAPMWHGPRGTGPCPLGSADLVSSPEQPLHPLESRFPVLRNGLRALASWDVVKPKLLWESCTRQGLGSWLPTALVPGTRSPFIPEAPDSGPGTAWDPGRACQPRPAGRSFVPDKASLGWGRTKARWERPGLAFSLKNERTESPVLSFYANLVQGRASP